MMKKSWAASKRCLSTLDNNFFPSVSDTYDHRLERTGHPVRSAIHKLEIGRLVVGWVTTSEYLLLYVFVFFPLFKLSGPSS
jgi:hypothetical protein